MSLSAQPIDVLLVDDDLVDIQLTRRSIDRAAMLRVVHVARDGVDAMAYLRREGEYAAAPRPQLVLLDLNMPRMDGREVLQAIKSDAALKRLPVVMFSTSDNEQDVAWCSQQQASSFITKPSNPALLTETILSIAEYWTKVVSVPAQEVFVAEG